jgi:hypothetical protein
MHSPAQLENYDLHNTRTAALIKLLFNTNPLMPPKTSQAPTNYIGHYHTLEKY